MPGTPASRQIEPILSVSLDDARDVVFSRAHHLPVRVITRRGESDEGLDRIAVHDLDVVRGKLRTPRPAPAVMSPGTMRLRATCSTYTVPRVSRPICSVRFQRRSVLVGGRGVDCHEIRLYMIAPPVKS